MTNFSEIQMEQIKSSVEGSRVWEAVNANVKALYEKFNRVPSDEEYQVVRTMIFCKTVLEDKNVMKTLSNMTWEALRQQ